MNKEQSSKYRASSQVELDGEFIESCIFENIEEIKYLLTSPDLILRPNIHDENEAAFKALLNSDCMDIIEYLIFDIGIEKTSIINDLLVNWPNDFGKRVMDLFNIRDVHKELNKELNKELDTNHIKDKKFKV